MIINRIWLRRALSLLPLRTRHPSIPLQRQIALQTRGPLFGARKVAYGYRSEEAYIDFDKDYYQVLGVDKKATFQEIKTQFYLLAKQHHPDKEQGDQSFFKEINEAYNVLSQCKLKQEYDANRILTSDPHPHSSQHPKPLNYNPYSQMSQAQWSYVRRGAVNHSRTDYTNYERIQDPEKELELELKKQQQWSRAFRSITPEQIREENQFREKLAKKYLSDIHRRKQQKEEFLERRLSQVASQVERILGKRARSLFQKMISK